MALGGGCARRVGEIVGWMIGTPEGPFLGESGVERWGTPPLSKSPPREGRAPALTLTLSQRERGLEYPLRERGLRPLTPTFFLCVRRDMSSCIAIRATRFGKARP